VTQGGFAVVKWIFRKESMLVMAALVISGALLTPWRAAAGTFEYSLGFSFNRSNYSDDDFSWNRRWGTSLGYHFNDRSEVEFAYQDIVDRTRIDGYEDTTFHDQIYSFNWVQNLLDKNSAFQPYVKLGLGQLNRSATGNYAGGASPPSLVDSVTVVLGGGLRLYLTRAFALRFEATSYLSGGSVRTWKDNIGVQFGTSIFF
jgi:hypothetical protein